jgi:hypothetical protein
MDLRMAKPLVLGILLYSQAGCSLITRRAMKYLTLHPLKPASTVTVKA